MKIKFPSLQLPRFFSSTFFLFILLLMNAVSMVRYNGMWEGVVLGPCCVMWVFVLSSLVRSLWLWNFLVNLIRLSLFVCLCLTSHRELSHMEMEPLIKVSTDRLEKLVIEPGIPGSQGKWFIHYTTAASLHLVFFCGTYANSADPDQTPPDQGFR